ncbi:hypothetical protein [Actinoplanes sp. NPDC051411]
MNPWKLFDIDRTATEKKVFRRSAVSIPQAYSTNAKATITPRAIA